MSRTKANIEQCPQCFGTWPLEPGCDVCASAGFVYTVSVRCGYCGSHPKDDPCAAGRRARVLVEAMAESLTARFAPGATAHRAPQTSEQMRLRADRLREMAAAVKLNGGHVQPGYEDFNGDNME